MLKDWHPDIGSDGSLPLQCIAINPRLSSNFAVKQIFLIPGVYLHIAVSLSPLSNKMVSLISIGLLLVSDYDLSFFSFYCGWGTHMRQVLYIYVAHAGLNLANLS